MECPSNLGKIAILAVFPFVAGCFGGEDDFEPATGASIEVEELEALIQAAVAGLDLEQLNSLPIEAEVVDDRSSCFDVVSGPCSVSDGRSSPPGHAVFYRDDGGREIGVSLQIAIDSLAARDIVEGHATALKSIQTRTLRQLSEPVQRGDSVVGGPCDVSADQESDEGCAYQKRGSPGVGNDARALRSDVLEDDAYTVVVLARESVYAFVTVRQHGGGAPGGLADDIAQALDVQIKQALSR